MNYLSDQSNLCKAKTKIAMIDTSFEVESSRDRANIE